MRDGFVKVASGTSEVKVADCGYNTQSCLEMIRQAQQQGAKILCLPELVITGYTCGDLFLQETLLDGAEASLEAILRETAELDVLTAVGLPLRRQRGHAQRRSAPQICAPHRRPIQGLCPCHHRRPSGYPNIRPHPNQLIHMAIAVLKHIFLKHRRSLAPQQRRHQNSLRIRWKSRIGRCSYGPNRFQRPAAPADNSSLI